MNTIEKTTKATKATAPKSATRTGEVVVHLYEQRAELDRQAIQAGTTGTNLARILIRDGLARLKSGEVRIAVAGSI